MAKDQSARCVQCGKKIVFSNENKDLWPFCSKRCKMIDLGKWLGEKYVVQEPATQDDVFINKTDQGNEDE